MNNKADGHFYGRTRTTDIPLYTRNLWGGVVSYGRATLNTSSGVNGNAALPKYDVFEGLSDTQVGGQDVNRFGGNDDNDNSGVFRYVSIREEFVALLKRHNIAYDERSLWE